MAKNISIRFNASQASDRVGSSRSPSPMRITFDEVMATTTTTTTPSLTSTTAAGDKDSTPHGVIDKPQLPGSQSFGDDDGACADIWNDATSYGYDSDHVIDNVIEELNRSHLEDEEAAAAAALSAAFIVNEECNNNNLISSIKPIRPTTIQLNGSSLCSGVVDANRTGEDIFNVIADKVDTTNDISVDGSMTFDQQAAESCCAGAAAAVDTSANKPETISMFQFKKKKNTATVGSKVDRFVRQLQGSFGASTTTISQTKSESSSPTTIKRIVKPVNVVAAAAAAATQVAADDTELGDVFDLSHASNISSSSSLSNSVNNLTKAASSVAPTSSSSSSSTGWFNEMKFFRDKLRISEKNKSNEEKGNNNNGCGDNNLSVDSHPCGKGAGGAVGAVGPAGSGSTNNLIEQVRISSHHHHHHHQQQRSDLVVEAAAAVAPALSSCTQSRKRSPTPPDTTTLSEAAPTSDETGKKVDKESKKTSKNLTTAAAAAAQRKKSKDESKTGGTGGAALKVKPNKQQPSCSSPNTTTSLGNFFSIITTSNKQSTIAAVPEVTPSNFSSFENIPTAVASNESTSNNNNMKLQKSSKIPSSKSMVSFRKTKNGNEEVNIEENLQSVFQPTYNVSQNPTLRRKTISDISFKLNLSNVELPRNQLDSHSTSSGSDLSEAIYRRDSVQESNSLHGSTLSAFDEKVPQAELTRTQRLRNSMLQGLRQPNFSDLHFIFYAFTICVGLVSIIMALLSPLPQFLNGLLLGLIITFLFMVGIIFYVLTNYFFVRSESAGHANGGGLRRPGTPDAVSLRRSRLRKMTFSPSNNNLSSLDQGAFSGWVSEFIGEYEERETEGFRSRLVFMILQGSVIYLLTPKEEMTEKKLKQLMTQQDTKSNNHIAYTSFRLIDFSKLSFKRVTLFLTKNVRNQRKYIWSKKYPICIEFSDDRREYNNSGGYIVQFTSSHPPDDYIAGGGRDNGSATDAKNKSVTPSPNTTKLVIFARTCREKEEWYLALRNAIEATSSSSLKNLSSLAEEQQQQHSVSTGDLPSATSNGDGEANAKSHKYLNILTRRLDYQSFLKSNVLNIEGVGGSGMMSPLTWLNVLLNRLAFDILNKPNWSAYIAKKLQRKLKKVRLPYFLENLTITDIDIGDALPKFNSVPTVPTVDEAGLWIDFDVSYSGGFTMTLETRLNLSKIKGLDNFETMEAATSSASNKTAPLSAPIESSGESFLNQTVPPSGRTWVGYKYRSHTMCESNQNLNEMCDDSDSDLDSIVTSSEDEEPETAPADPDDADTDFKQKKFTRVVDRIAGNQYFQRMSQTNFMRKMLEGFSKISIILTVQLKSLDGTLAINIPESPSDRLWYGFRNEPQIQITARPKLGDHDVNVNYVTNLIEKKLKSEFFNYFVIPNMDDFFIPALNANIEPNISVVP